MRRREFITLFGGAGAASINRFGASAQPSQRMRRIAVFVNARGSTAPERGLAAFRQSLAELGWSEGRNVRFEQRAGAGDPDLSANYAAELLALAPDLIVLVSFATPMAAALQRLTRTVPIVFVGALDPVGAGVISSLARPGGNATGFTAMEFSTSGKWLELLKQIAPSIKRVAVLRVNTVGGGGQFGAIQGAASSLGVEVSPINMRDASDLERDINAFARGPNGGLIVTLSTAAAFQRDLIIALAARHHLPAVYPGGDYVANGGLVSYGPVIIDQFRQAAGYADRILRGEKPAELPVQAPVKYETVLNLKTAKALGLTVPDLIIVRADEVIE